MWPGCETVKKMREMCFVHFECEIFDEKEWHLYDHAQQNDQSDGDGDAALTTRTQTHMILWNYVIFGWQRSPSLSPVSSTARHDAGANLRWTRIFITFVRVRLPRLFVVMSAPAKMCVRAQALVAQRCVFRGSSRRVDAIDVIAWCVPQARLWIASRPRHRMMSRMWIAPVECVCGHNVRHCFEKRSLLEF